MAEAAVSSNPDVQYFQKLLNDRKIRLPEGVLTQEAVERSRNPDVIEDAKLIKEALMNGEIHFSEIPRLACRDVKDALNKMKNNAREITEKIFFTKKQKKSKKRASEADESKTKKKKCRENTEKIFSPNKPVLATKQPDRERAKKTEDECLEFFKREILPEVGEGKIQSHQVEYEKEKTVEFGFLNGRIDVQATVTNSKIQQIIIECKGTEGDMVGKVFNKPSEGHRAKLIKKHPYYHQILSYKYILQNLIKTKQDAVQAVMVLRLQSGDNHPEFYWNHVDGDLKKIHQLNEFCTEEALPRFLALLKLMDQPGTSSDVVEISDDEDE